MFRHVLALFLGILFSTVAGASRDQHVKDAILCARQFETAVSRNEVPALRGYLAPEWEVVSAEGTIISRAAFLDLIASGTLSHRHMSSSEERIQAYGSMVIISARARSIGSYRNVNFETDERSTDVLLIRGGRCQYVHTQLTAIAAQP